jgi:hypothetical protein
MRLLIAFIYFFSYGIQVKAQESKDRATIAHVVHMGQSLASGDDSYPIISSIDTGGGNLRFECGPHTWMENEANPEDRINACFDLVPLTQTGRGGRGETIGNGLADTLRPALDPDTRILFSYAGEGSKRLRELDFHDEATDPRALYPTRGGYYRTNIDDVKRAMVSAEARGWNYKVLALTWMQGEKNGDLRISDWDTPKKLDAFTDAYANDLINLKNKFNQDISLITGQTERVRMFSYQTSLALSGQAQLIASDRDPEIIIIGPTYQMERADSYSVNGRFGNYQHLTSDSQRWLGAQFAKVMRRVLVKSEVWQPLKPISAHLANDRKVIILHYHVPNPPLVVDTTFVPQQEDFGFNIAGGPAIKKALVVGTDTLELTLATPLPVGEFFIGYTADQLYAGRLPIGNIRDSDSEKSNYIFQNGSRRGMRYPMWNWSVAFQRLKINE